MNVRVRLFAQLRERAGERWLDIDLPERATVEDALVRLGRDGPLAGLLDELPVALAVNRDYASAQTVLRPGDELALIPPLSGGAGEARLHVRVGEEPLSLERVTGAVSDPRCGAIVVFEGVTREVEALEYEAYREMAEERIAALLAECARRHGLVAAATEHRTGRVALGEASILVAASAPHRDAAFAGARAAIDEIKRQAPIWKREIVGGREARWVGGTPAPAPSASPPGTDPPAVPSLTHLDEEGSARMVDVAVKPVSARRALARARVRMSPACAAAVQAGEAPKGEVLATARLAGVMAAKRTDELIPLAHPLATTFVDVRTSVDVPAGLVELVAEARASDRTGVEMEAMTACAVAALTVYDMVKGIERGVSVEELRLIEKTGGKSGDWRLDEDGAAGEPAVLDPLWEG